MVVVSRVWLWRDVVHGTDVFSPEEEKHRAETQKWGKASGVCELYGELIIIRYLCGLCDVGLQHLQDGVTMVIPDVYIVGKDNEWLTSYRPDITQLPRCHIWSKYMWDAKQFSNIPDARRKAKQFGGEVYKFNPASGKAELVKRRVPEICDTCRRYTPLDGTCKNRRSEYYMVPVSMKDSCIEWEERA